MTTTETVRFGSQSASPEGASAIMVGTPRLVVRIGGVVSVFALLVALVGMGVGVLALVRGQVIPAAWWLVLLEFVAALGAMYGAMGGLRDRFKSGPALALLIASGTALVAALLGERTFVTRAMGRGGPWTVLAGVPVMPIAAAQLVIASVLGALAAAAVLMREPKKSIPMLVVGAVMLAPVFVGLAALASGQARGAMGAWYSNNPLIGTIAGGLAALVGGVLLCLGVHKVIRAFEIGIAAGLVRGTSDQTGP